MKLPFGKYKDQEIEDVPLSYLKWCEENSVLLIPVREEIARRKKLETNSTASIQLVMPRDVALEHLLVVLNKFPDQLFNREITLDKRFKFRVERVSL